MMRCNPVDAVDVTIFWVDGEKSNGEEVTTTGDNYGVLSASGFVGDCYATAPFIELSFGAGFVRRRDCRICGVGEKATGELEALIETPFGFGLALAPGVTSYVNDGH